MSSPQVEYRQLGKSGLRVSVPILGAMSVGSDKWLSWILNEKEVRLAAFRLTWTLFSNVRAL
jgi:aryl-alcohol dehydrogenase-like predicted oxidoreductase